MHLSGILKESKRPEVIHGPGSLSRLEELLPRYKNVLLFSGRESFKLTGAAEFFEGYKTNHTGTVFQHFSYSGKALPLDDIEGIYNEVKKLPAPDAIIAVGGGTAMDLAKVIAAARSNRYEKAEQVITDAEKESATYPELIFVPTTAGTGSETTSFAVVYKDKRKISIDRKKLLPGIAILDPLLLKGIPERILNTTILDALSQAIESAWSKAATRESREFSRLALAAILENLEPEIRGKGFSIERFEGLLLGSHLAGRAIDITRTTLCHSISYPFTAHFGVPHGVAVFLTLPEIARINFQADPGSLQDGLEMAHIHEVFSIFFDVFGVKGIDALTARLRDIVKLLGFGPGFGGRLRDWGVKKDDLAFLAANALTAGRSDNNPVKVGETRILEMLEGLL